MQYRTTHKAATVVALVAVAATGLAACSGDPGTGTGTGTGEEQTLRIVDYYTSDPGKSIRQEVYDRCAEEVGVSLDVSHVAEIIPAFLQQAQANDLPDVLMVENSDIQQVASSGALVPLSQYDVSTDGFAKGVVEASTYEGELYGLQPATNSIALFYNRDLLEDAGIEPPENWEELRSSAAALTQDGRYGMAVSAVNTGESAWQFMPFLWSAGGDETDLGTPEAANALQLWVDLYQDGSMSPSVVNWTQADVNDQFLAGNVAMMVNGPWQFPTLDDSGIDFAVVPIPPETTGGTSIAPLGGETYTVPATGDETKQALAAEFVKCMSSDENELFLAEENQLVPTKTELAQQYAETNPNIQAFADLLPDLRARAAQLGPDFPATGTAIATAIQEALVGGKTADQAMADAKSSLD